MAKKQIRKRGEEGFGLMLSAVLKLSRVALLQQFRIEATLGFVPLGPDSLCLVVSFTFVLLFVFAL